MKIKTNVSRLYLAIALASTATAASATQVFSEDVIVQGSECVGTDCASSDAFGFDTFRLKENNLRIHFDDTSSSGSFPKNDWRIVINDTNSGGESHFSIEDSTAGKTPFRIDAGAKNNTLVVDSTGMVGFGTDSPKVTMHAVSGDSPSLRLEQDGSSGYSAQRWDLVGNEANFFLRDATTGSKLPFRVKPYSPTDSLYIQPNYVYFGNKVYIKENSDQYEPRIEVQNTNAVNYEAMRLTTPLDSIDLANSANEFQVNFANTGISGVPEMSLDNTGTLTVQGNLVANGVTYTSSRAAKANFSNVNADEILAKVDQLDVLSWNYNRDPESIRHIGPMAEDFHKQFGLNGDKDGVISASDVNGVALAAIKALKSRSDSLEQELDQKDQEIEGLRRAVDELRAAIAR
ncbi:tail fiber domain-containing protein [Microbulbifer sp. ALW1]|uniref:tail fiber domain-containing protein n=1 Tax=Microbulbifer sp. (strain ALW1) TaxID=1516059 RepID=UPI00135C3D4F|nr:tail fiber domain-containing protein [Microbulbifer sp. ALW1]